MTDLLILIAGASVAVWGAVVMWLVWTIGSDAGVDDD